MFAALLITLRETLEVSLVVGIVLAFLTFTKNVRHKKYVWAGVAGGLVVSIIVAYLFNTIGEGFEGRAEEIYEGVTMFIAAGLLTWMIFWMINQGRTMKKHIEGKVAAHVENNHAFGIFMLVLVAVAREGVETVIFLQAALFSTEAGATLAGALLGIAVAILLAVLLFKGFSGVALPTFFKATSILLLLFAAGLVAHGIHEFNEAGVLPALMDPVWDMNSLINEDGTLGGFLEGLFGYNGNPSLLEVIGYVAYIVTVSALWKRMTSRKTA